MALADLDGDSDLDAVFVLNGVWVHRNLGDGTFEPGVQLATGQFGSVTTADLDGDGHIDLAVADMTGDGLDDIVAVLEFHDPPSIAVMINAFTIGGDVDGDGSVGITDFLALLALWGPCPDPPAECVGDQDADGVVGITDLLILLANWS